MESENERQSSISFAGEEKEKRARGSTLLHFMCQVFRGWQELVFFLMYFLLCLLVTRTCSMIVFVAWRSVNGGNLFRRAIVVLCCYISALSARK